MYVCTYRNKFIINGKLMSLLASSIEASEISSCCLDYIFLYLPSVNLGKSINI